ncbi:hypothetical protein DL93DRAFT_2066436, partial [Clavulina sp. PMI_390]
MQERPHYGPFSDLCGSISELWLLHIAPHAPCEELVVPYDRSTLDGIDGAASLRPDLVSIRGGKTLDTLPKSRCWWRDIDFVVEVKGDWKPLVAQAGTYARALLSVDPRRTFALVIAYNHEDHQVRFLFFHRGG